MGREDLAEFFLASAGAGGAFVGLLFVAVSIGPQRTFGGPAITGAPRQRLAEAALVTLANGFIVSSIALVPGVTVGWVALVLGITGVVAAAHLGWLFARYHRHRSSADMTWRDVLRSACVSVVATVVFAIEALLGLLFVLEPTNVDLLRGLAFAIIALYSLGILRAWTLLGDPQYGLSGWLNPLQDLEAMEEMAEQQDETGLMADPGPLPIGTQRANVAIALEVSAADRHQAVE